MWYIYLWMVQFALVSASSFVEEKLSSFKIRRTVSEGRLFTEELTHPVRIPYFVEDLLHDFT